MRKAVKIMVLLLGGAFLAAQFVRPDRTDPIVNIADTLEVSQRVDAPIGDILKRSCNDCHSNATVYPWYAQISPFSWFLGSHVRDGRENLNFSVWGTYEKSRKAKKLEEICEQVRTAEMPLPSYLWIHRDAVLREGEARLLCEWTDRERQPLQ